jgi:hypothetical protein
MTHNLDLANIHATFSKDKDLIGKQDPYCIFEVGSARTQTKAIKGAGKEAAWQNVYSLDGVDPSASELTVVVYNHNTLLPDSVIGSGRVNLSRLPESHFTGSPTTIPLEDRKGGYVGDLSLVMNGGGYKGRGTTASSGSATTERASAVSGSATAERERQDALDKRAAGSGPAPSLGTPTGHTTDTKTEASGYGIKGSHDTGHTEIERDAEGKIIDCKYYTTIEDRPVDQQLVEKVREHTPFEQEYKTSVQATGRERQLKTDVEALGAEERVIGSETVVQGQPHKVIERHLPEGYLNERPGGEGWVQGKPGPVCDEKTFAVEGDRIVDKERVTALKEHREFEKEFEVKTRMEGTRLKGEGVHPEVIDRQRVVTGEAHTTPCEGHPEL